MLPQMLFERHTLRITHSTPTRSNCVEGLLAGGSAIVRLMDGHGLSMDLRETPHYGSIE